MRPVLIYDNLCSSCTKYAMIVDRLTKRSLSIIGHYTQSGKQYKKEHFPEDYDGLDMSWFIIDGKAYGGRAGLFKLVEYMIFGTKTPNDVKNEFSIKECTTDCKTVKGVLFRSCSIITHYCVFPIRSSK